MRRTRCGYIQHLLIAVWKLTAPEVPQQSSGFLIRPTEASDKEN